MILRGVKVKKKQEFASAKSKNYLTKNGFVMVSNLIFDRQVELGASNEELLFLIRVMKNCQGFHTTDANLDPTKSTRTLQRYRKNLKELGLLDYKVYKVRDSNNDFYSYIVYDLNKLEEKLQKLSDTTETKKEREIKEIEKNEETIDEDVADDEPEPPKPEPPKAKKEPPKKKEASIKKTLLEENKEKFQSDWKSEYGNEYNFSDEEDKWLSKKEDASFLRYIFDWCHEMKEKGDLPDDVNPRIAFFMKTKFRCDQMRKWAEEKEERDLENWDPLEDAIQDFMGKDDDEEPETFSNDSFSLNSYRKALDRAEQEKNQKPEIGALGTKKPEGMDEEEWWETPQGKIDFLDLMEAYKSCVC
jgi:hypothetical protein